MIARLRRHRKGKSFNHRGHGGTPRKDKPKSSTTRSKMIVWIQAAAPVSSIRYPFSRNFDRFSCACAGRRPWMTKDTKEHKGIAEIAVIARHRRHRKGKSFNNRGQEGSWKSFGGAIAGRSPEASDVLGECRHRRQYRYGAGFPWCRVRGQTVMASALVRALRASGA